MTSKAPDCPPKQTLINFLLGKLDANQLEICEQHLNECQPCGDTIRNLEVNDTLVELAGQAALEPRAGTSAENPDELIVKMLIDKISQMSATQPGRSQALVMSSSGRVDEVSRFLSEGKTSDGLGRLGHYEIQEVLGVGATSVVFRAWDEQLHRQVALKVLLPSLGEDARKRFLAEARAAAAIDHENVITIYQVATEGELAFMAQQWLPGETLETRLASNPQLDVDQIRDIARQVADGLAAAHAKNLIHRDIKPANIWIESERNRAIILDFGLVRVADDEPQVTETGMIAGTPTYMSPEQARGREIDSRSDLFSLGCVLYRLCTGRIAFEAPNTLATLQSIQKDEPQPPAEINSSVPDELSDLVMALLSKDPMDRPQRAKQVAEWIVDPAAMKRELAQQVPELESKIDKPRSHVKWWLRGAATVALLAVALFAFSGPQIVRIVTNQGVLVIESNDPDIEIEVLQGGEVIKAIDKQTGQEIEIAAGEYTLRPKGDANVYKLSPDKLTMSRGGKLIVTVTKTRSDSSDNDVSGTNASSEEIKRGLALIEKYNRQIKQLEIEREKAESTQDLNANRTAAESIVDLRKQLVSTAIDLRESGALPANKVEEFKQALAADNRHLEWLEVPESKFTIPELEERLNIFEETYQLHKAQFDAGLIHQLPILHSQVKWLQADLDLTLAKGEYALAAKLYANIVQTHQMIVDTTQKQVRSGNVELIKLPDVKLALSTAKSNQARFLRLHPELADSSKADARSAEESLTYENRTFEQWLKMLETERSTPRLQTAFTALQALASEANQSRIAAEILKSMRVFGEDTLGGSPAGELRQKAWQILGQLPADVVTKAVLDEIAVANPKSGGFLIFFPLQKPALEAAAKEKRDALVDGLIRRFDDENVEWSARLLASLASRFKWQSSEIISALQLALKNIQSDQALLGVSLYLAKTAPETDGLENKLLGLLDLQQYGGVTRIPHHAHWVFQGLKEMGPEHITEKSVDKLIELLSNKKVWPPRLGDGSVQPGWGNPQLDAIKALGSFGAKAKPSVDVLNVLEEEGKAANAAVVNILAPQHARQDLHTMQGRWNLVDPQSGIYASVEGFELRIVSDYFGRGRQIIERAQLEFGEQPGHVKLNRLELILKKMVGEIKEEDYKFFPSSVMNGIYKLEGKRLMICFNPKLSGDAPKTFEAGDSARLLVFERDN